jgi:protein-tyrosine phosphatase
MPALGRALLFVGCAALGCDGASDDFRIESHRPAEPEPIAAGSGGSAAEPGANAGGPPSVLPSGGAIDTGCQSARPVLTSDLKNARDVGGTPLEQGGSVACGSIFRGPPLVLGEAGCAEVRALGIRTVIDLRIESEAASKPDASCVNADFVPTPLPIPYGLSASDYLADLNATASMTKVFRTFGDPQSYPLYFHCTWGRDRTGVVAAVLLLTLGVSRADVMAEYMLSQPSVGAYPAALEAVLDEVEARGGAEAFLMGMGITAEQIAVMRSHTKP